jgi:prophage maintenance system killer protein
VYAASAIRHQFYFDGNKRTAKLMASGELLAHGYDAISIPYSRLHEQNLSLDELFRTDDATALMMLLADCARG